MSKELKAQDLRIGNYLSYHNQNVQIMALDKNRAEFGYFSDSIGFIRSFNNEDFPKPIPLTEDWLVKLPEDLVSEDIPSWIVFLHQLQNWYWIEKKCTKEFQFK